MTCTQAGCLPAVGRRRGEDQGRQGQLEPAVDSDRRREPTDPTTADGSAEGEAGTTEDMEGLFKKMLRLDSQIENQLGKWKAIQAELEEKRAMLNTIYHGDPTSDEYKRALDWLRGVDDD